MISAASIREQKVVQSADTTPLSQRYGFKIAATPDQLRTAKAFVEGMVSELEGTIDEHFSRLRDIGENPYRESVETGSYSRKIEHGTKVIIFSQESLKAQHDKVFNVAEKSREKGAEAAKDAKQAPDLATLYMTAIEDLRVMYRGAGFDVYGPYRYEGADFLVLCDPEYVKARQAFIEAKQANDAGAARDKKWFRRLLIALHLAKPHQVLALPAPGPKAPAALPAPAVPAAAPTAPEPSRGAKAQLEVAIVDTGLVAPAHPAVVDTGIAPLPALVGEAGGFSIPR